MLGDRQPQPGTARLARTSTIDTVEALGQPRNMLRGNADTGVAHAELCVAGLAVDQNGVPCQADGAAVRGVAHRVADQIGERGMQLLRATAHPQIGTRFHLDLMPSAGQRLRLVLVLRHHRRHVDDHFGRRIGIALQPRQHKQIVHQMPHAVGLGLHHVEHAQALGFVERHVAHGFDEPPQHGQRGLDLMRHIGHEIAAHRLGALELRDVLRQQQFLLIAVGKDLHAQRELRPRTCAVHVQGLVKVRRLEIGDKLGGANQVHRMLAKIALRVQTEVLRRSGVAPVDLVVFIEQNHPVGRDLQRLDEAVQLGLLVAQTPRPQPQLTRCPVKHFGPGARAIGHRCHFGRLEPADQSRQRDGITRHRADEHQQRRHHGARAPVDQSPNSCGHQNQQQDKGDAPGDRDHGEMSERLRSGVVLVSNHTVKQTKPVSARRHQAATWVGVAT